MVIVDRGDLGSSGADSGRGRRTQRHDWHCRVDDRVSDEYVVARRDCVPSARGVREAAGGVLLPWIGHVAVSVLSRARAEIPALPPCGCWRFVSSHRHMLERGGPAGTLEAREAIQIFRVPFHRAVHAGQGSTWGENLLNSVGRYMYINLTSLFVILLLTMRYLHKCRQNVLPAHGQHIESMNLP